MLANPAAAAGAEPEDDDGDDGWPLEEAEGLAAAGAGGAAASGSVIEAETVEVPSVHSFLRKHPLGNAIIHVTLLEGSAFLWIGDAKLGLDDLHVSMPTPYDPLPSVTTLRGDSEGPSSGMAQKLSKRFGMLVFLSFNLSNPDMQFLLYIHKEVITILEELQKKAKRTPAAAES
mmetsp:Transcript_11892/g.21749  ORF Transcript_11892/g.21749 Transcript_11892/m.21749 type:complete len:174 (-) Transcript_11892:12-533(-)